MYLWVAWSYYWVELEERKVFGNAKTSQLRLESWADEAWFVKGKESVACSRTSLKNFLTNGLKIFIVAK